MTSPSEVVLAVKDYRYWYVREGDQGEVKTLALDKINFEVRRGEFVLLLGPTSSGKTTLCLNILGILPDLLGGLNQGEILLHDGMGLVNRKDIPREKRFLYVNMVFQDPNDQLVSLTVQDEIAFALENYQVPRDEIMLRIDEALDLVGMSRFRQSYVSTLSGGEKQRVAIAAILALRPQILLLDQPTSNLDPVGTVEVLEAISEIRKRLDITIMLIEHAIDGIYETVDKVLLLADKTIQFSGTPRELIDKYGLELRDCFGLWLPQASEVGLRLRQQGLAVDPIPISADEVVTSLRKTGVQNAALPRREAKHERAFAGSRSGEPVVSVRNLSFSYPTQPGVLNDISFDVYPGEMVALLGQNGSGKTTMISHLPGIVKPTSGEILIKGTSTQTTTIQELAHHVAYVFQYPDRQFITGTVEAEMAHGLKAVKTPQEEITRKVEQFLRQVDLWDQRSEHPYSLSHGQKRRLSVACMQIMQPELIILDEPTFGLDWQQVMKLVENLYQLTKSGDATALFVTHDMRLVAEYAQRVLVLHQSHLIFDGSPNELFANAEVMSKTNLKAPPVWYFSQQAIGHGLARPQDLCATVAEAVKQ